MAKKISTEIHTSSKECVQSITASTGNFVQDVTCIAPPSGRTPQKRTYIAPDSFTHTRQTDIIMNEVRQSLREQQKKMVVVDHSSLDLNEKASNVENIIWKHASDNKKHIGIQKPNDGVESSESRVIEPLAAQDPNTI